MSVFPDYTLRSMQYLDLMLLFGFAAIRVGTVGASTIGGE